MNRQRMAQTKQDLLREVHEAIELVERRLDDLRKREQSADAHYEASRSDADAAKADRAMGKRFELQSLVSDLRVKASLLQSDIAEGKLGWHQGRVTGG